jgi:AsmA protein
MIRTLNGTASLHGSGLTVHGTDIDGALSTVAAAQRLNLAEVGAFLLAAPLGRAASKGYRFGGIRGDAGRAKDTAVTKLVSDWTVRDGVAQARDVALATRKNRIALQGRLDMPNERFAGVTVAVLDPAGARGSGRRSTARSATRGWTRPAPWSRRSSERSSTCSRRRGS